MASATKDAPFCERYALPAQVSQNLGEVSWETVEQLSCDYQAKAADQGSKVKKIIKELHLSRLLLLGKIRESAGRGNIDPSLLVDAVRLMERCEEVANEYDLDLKEFSSFLYLISEKLKKERLARHEGKQAVRRIAPIGEELAHFKGRSEQNSKPAAKPGKKGGK